MTDTATGRSLGDRDHIVYHDDASQGSGIWLLSTDGVSPPQLLVPNGYSPAVQR